MDEEGNNVQKNRRIFGTFIGSKVPFIEIRIGLPTIF